MVENFIINKGTTWKLVITWKDSDGVVINVSGYSVKIQFRKHPNDSAVLYEMSTTNGKITLDGAAGKITCTAPKEDTASFVFLDALFDVLATSPGGEATRLLSGSVTVSPAITR